ncbi:MipA/OmpV family protein [Colwelliaceae bacterium 6441]
MKDGLALLMLALCFPVFASSENEEQEIREIALEKSFSSQWGIDAINIPKHLPSTSAESLGLILPEPIALSGSLLSIENENYRFNNGNYQLTSSYGSVLDTQNTDLDFTYSNGRFSAQTGITSNSGDILSSGKLYFQGAYSIFNEQNLVISLTAKVEALGEKSVNRYFGENSLTSNNSIFQQHQATNTTLGIVSTYAINKHWKILGMISATNLDNKIESSPLIDNNNLHMALIGTSYSF